MRWQKKLTKKEIKHLRETIIGPPTLRAFKVNLEFQRKCDAENEKRDNRFPMTCMECHFIAKKLGL